MISWHGAATHQTWQTWAVGFTWTAIAVLTIVEPPSLNVCDTAVLSLVPARIVVSLVDDRHVGSLVPDRTVEKECV